MATYTSMPAILNLDWLAFSVKLVPSPREKDDHTWYLQDISEFGFRLLEFPGNNIYKRRAIIYNSDGEKLITFLFDPHSKVIPYDSCLVEVANKWLYSSNVAFDGTRYSEHNLNWVTDILTWVHPYVISNMSRIDICADFECTPYQYDIIRGLAANRLYVQKYREGSMFHDYNTQSCERYPKCLSWGSKRSNVKWKLYHKSKELFTWVKEGEKMVKYCSKPYIVSQWHSTWDTDSHTLDEDNVWRLEVSISPAEKYTFHGTRITYADVINQFYIDDLFLSLYMNRFVTRRNEGHKDHTNDHRVFLLGDVGAVDRMRVKQPESSREVAEYVSCLRSAMSQRSKVEVQVNTQMMHLWTTAAIECVRIGHLESYFQNTYGLPIERIDELVSTEINLQST